jgi:hypothetical protein
MANKYVKHGGVTFGPRVEATESFTVTLLANTNTPQDLATILPNVKAGGVIGFRCTVADTQIAFGDAAVTIVAANPPFPTGTVHYMVPSGQFLSLKSTGAAVVYLWDAGRIAL